MTRERYEPTPFCSRRAARYNFLIRGPRYTRLRRSGNDKFGGRGLDNSVAIVKLVDQNGPLRG